MFDFLTKGELVLLVERCCGGDEGRKGEDGGGEEKVLWYHVVFMRRWNCAALLLLLLFTVHRGGGRRGEGCSIQKYAGKSSCVHLWRECRCQPNWNLRKFERDVFPSLPRSSAFLAVVEKIL